jgi:nucleoside 2-deoxyribosyltransferase
MVKKIYLAGGMHGNWQDKAAVLLPGFQTLDPRSWAVPDPEIYTRRDIAAIKECDAVLAFMEASNPGGHGLCLEVGFAVAMGRPVVFLDGLGDDPRSRYFGMVRQVSSATIGTLEFACQWIRRNIR